MIEIPVFEGVESAKPAAKGRTIEYEFDEEERTAYLAWPEQWRRKWRPLRDPDDNHILTDAEIDNLLYMINHGYKESAFIGTDQFLKYLKYRQQIPETTYGSWQSDVSVVRFFENKTSVNIPNSHGDKKESILADIRAMNEKQGMGNVKIPGTTVEIINYSPCPSCGHVHSFSDIFNYYQKPAPDTFYQSKLDQYVHDTRVMCIECKAYFLPALIVVDGDPKNEHQMICRRQTMAEVVTFMAEFHLKVLYMREENIITHPDNGRKAWRNDVDAKLLKKRQGLFTNFLSYTPAPQILNFITRKNLTIDDPLYGAWLEPDRIWWKP